MLTSSGTSNNAINKHRQTMSSFGDDDDNESKNDTEISDYLIVESSYRYKYLIIKSFVILFIISFLCFCSSMHWVTFSALSNFKANYEIGSLQLDLLTNIFYIVYPIVYLPSSYVIDHISVRLAVTINYFK